MQSDPSPGGRTRQVKQVFMSDLTHDKDGHVILWDCTQCRTKLPLDDLEIMIKRGHMYLACIQCRVILNLEGE